MRLLFSVYGLFQNPVVILFNKTTQSKEVESIPHQWPTSCLMGDYSLSYMYERCISLLSDWMSTGAVATVNNPLSNLPSPTALYAISVRQARVLPIKGPFNP